MEDEGNGGERDVKVSPILVFFECLSKPSHFNFFNFETRLFIFSF